jgi:hypothetical protein
MSKLAYCCAALAFICQFSVGAAYGQTPSSLPPGCSSDSSIQICVTSAAITFDDNYQPGGSDVEVSVSVSMRVSNASDYPIGVAALTDSWAFTPQNADTLTDNTLSRTIVSGVLECRQSRGCEFVTVAPGRSAIVQVRFNSHFGSSGLPLVQIARSASFSASLFVNERGEVRLIPLAIEGFGFGNGTVRGR